MSPAVHRRHADVASKQPVAQQNGDGPRVRLPLAPLVENGEVLHVRKPAAYWELTTKN